jgi:hypothetical protein
MICGAIVCSVVTFLRLASALWIGPPILPIVITMIFVVERGLLIVALIREFVEMWISLRTIEIEMSTVPTSSEGARID